MIAPLITLSFREARKLRVQVCGVVGFLDRTKQPKRIIDLKEDQTGLAMLFRNDEEYAIVSKDHISKF